MARPRHSPEDPDRLTIRIDPKLALRVRVLAVKQKRAISAVVEDALSHYIREAEKAWEAGADIHPIKSPTLKTGSTWTAEQVRQELVRLGSSQAALAEELGVRASLLSLWLGRRGIPFNRQPELTKAIQALRKRLRGK